MKPELHKIREEDAIQIILFHNVFNESVIWALHEIAETRDLNFTEYTALEQWSKDNLPFDLEDIKSVDDLLWYYEHDMIAEFEDEDEDERPVRWEELTPDEVELVERYRANQFKEYINEATK